MRHVLIGDEWAVSYARLGIAVLLLLSAISDKTVSFALGAGDYTVAPPVIAAMLSALLSALLNVILVGLAVGFLGWTSGEGGTPEEAVSEYGAAAMWLQSADWRYEIDQTICLSQTVYASACPAVAIPRLMAALQVRHGRRLCCGRV